MSNYTKSTNFATKDNLTPGDPLKVVRGTEIDTEFNNIATAVATKTDNASAAITGGTIDGATVGATTPATGAFTTLAASGTTTLAGALVGAVTQAAFNTVSTTLNLGGAATAVNLGAATGTATVNNTTLAAKAITASTTLAVTGTSTLTGAVTATAGVTGPLTSSSVTITGGSITGITDLAVADGGTGASTAAGGLNNLLPSQTSNANKYLQTDGTNASWDAVSLSTADITGTLGVANGGTGVTTSTGTTNVVLSNSPTLVTPVLGVATGTSFQGIIGNVTPAAASFTTLGASSTATLNTLVSSGATLTGGTINGMTVGATTATTGAFTTLTTSSTVTHNGGTANGVTYLNGSKVLTSGTALVFDGTNLGVGNASPTFALDIATATARVRLAPSVTTNAALFQATNTGGSAYFGLDNSAGTTFTTAYALNIYHGGNYPIIFSTNAAECLRLTSTLLYTASATNIAIGTSTATAATRLTIQESATNASALSLINRNSTQTWKINVDASAVDDKILAFVDNATSTVRLALTDTGNLGIGTTSPDANLTVNGAASFAAGTALLPSIARAGDLNTGLWFPAADTIAASTGGTERYRVDSSGNFGLGITPSAWSAGKAIEVGNVGNGLMNGGLSEFWMTGNAYFNGGWKYAGGNLASAYEQTAGKHIWNIAPSGTTGSALTFTQAMTLTTAGDLLVGTTSTNGSYSGKNITVAGPVNFNGTNTTTSVANGGTVNLITFTSTQQGTYLFTTRQSGQSNGGIIGFAVVAVGSNSLTVTNLISTSVSLSASTLTVVLTNNAGGTATFQWAYTQIM